MYTYSPPRLSNNQQAPLVVVLHGCLQNAKVVAKQSGWNKLADEYGFRVLYPEQRIINNPAKCFCWFNRNDIEKGKGENFSIQQMIESQKQNGLVDTSKIFIAGLSAGAAMAVNMLADYPAIFNAGAIFAGGAYKTATNIWTASLSMYGFRIKSPKKWAALVREQNPGYKNRYPRIIIYHGNADLVVNKRNGAQLMKQWTFLHAVGTQPTERIKRFAGTKVVEKNIYRDSDSNAVVIYYKLKRMGHGLPIDPGNCENKGGKRTSFSADKNFFSTYWTAVDFGLIYLPEIQGKKTITAFENNLTYSVHVNDKAKFEWSYPKNCKVLGNSSGNTITLNWGDESGNIDVKEITDGKCGRVFPTLLVKVAGRK